MTTLGPGGVLAPDALDTNRGGGLTPGQRAYWRSMSRGLRKTEFFFAIALIVIGALVWIAPGPAKDATFKPVVGVVCFVIAALLLVRALTGGDKLTSDVRDGRVQSIDGAITKRSVTTHSKESSITTHFFDVSHQSFEVNRDAYDLAPDAGYVSVFYLPRSHRVVNYEMLAPPATPELTQATLQQVAQSSITGMLSRDEVTRAETRARAVAMQAAVEQQLKNAAVPPPPEQRDHRPLAEAIVGSWNGPMASAVFSADGTVSATVMGRPVQGRWSVDGAGKLRTDVLGQGGAADAWITGNQLTVSVDNVGFTLERQS